MFDLSLLQFLDNARKEKGQRKDVLDEQRMDNKIGTQYYQMLTTETGKDNRTKI